MEIMVLGAGALGSYLGYILSKSCDVTLVARGEHAKAIKKTGLKVLEGRSRRSCKPRVVSKPVKGGWDHVLVTTKAYDAIPAVKKAMPVLQDGADVMLFLNGLGLEERVAKVLGKKTPISRGLTAHGFAITKSGTVRHTGTGRTMVGASRGKPKLKELAAAFNTGGLETKLVKDIRKESWIKAVVNASINPVSAAAGVRNGRLLKDPLLNDVMRKTCYEGAQVAREMINVSRNTLWKRTVEVATLTQNNRCSMLQDLDKGRPTEIDWINGEIISKADEFGIPVPVNRTLYAMIKAKEAYNQSGIL
jgi:2-dehydropantoate 2-reductase